MYSPPGTFRVALRRQLEASQSSTDSSVGSVSSDSDLIDGEGDLSGSKTWIYCLILLGVIAAIGVGYTIYFFYFQNRPTRGDNREAIRASDKRRTEASRSDDKSIVSDKQQFLGKAHPTPSDDTQQSTPAYPIQKDSRAMTATEHNSMHGYENEKDSVYDADAQDIHWQDSTNYQSGSSQITLEEYNPEDSYGHGFGDSQSSNMSFDSQDKSRSRKPSIEF